MGWAEHVARMREKGNTGMWWGNFREGDFFGDLSKGDRIILKWINK